MEYKGLPAYRSWADIPQGLHTKTQLKKERLELPDDATPVAYKRGYDNYPLYRREDAVPLPLKRKPRDYISLFEHRYTSKRAAYLDASSALFELNRYAKHESCTQRHRDQIYRLKNAWIKHLYEQGFCIEARQAMTPVIVLPEVERECWCEYGCQRCDGIGFYTLPEKKVGGRQYWSFRFDVDGQQFAWHQPGNSVSYPVSSIGNSAKDHDVLAEEKPVSLPSRKFAEAKAIIAWCLQGVPAERRELSTLCASGREGMRTV